MRTEIVSIHPNPFNPLTTVQLSLEKTGPVQVAIYDVRGQKVTDASDRDPGTWNARTDLARRG